MKVFYTMPQYEAWKEQLGGQPRGWDIKYYKGLGTSNTQEAKEYFAAIDHHRKRFVWQGVQPLPRCTLSCVVSGTNELAA